MQSHSISLIQRGSRTSVDLLDALVDNDDFGLVDESVSLDSLSTISIGTIPPFPADASLFALTLEGGAKYFEQSLTSMPFALIGDYPSSPHATTTVPTPPRLKCMLKENLSIQKWAESLIATDAPGHTPWADAEDQENVSWIAEGSIYSPAQFREALAKARSQRHTNDTQTISHRDKARQRKSFRNALVFEHEILLSTDGGAKRWSIQVPAETMNTEMVDMMLELRGLNAFFSDPCDRPALNIDPPSLIISNSHATLPLSLESSTDVNSGGAPPTSLATRRGRKKLPQISLAEKQERDPYPGIPTAFLGTPSAYSPEAKFPTGSNGSMPMNLQMNLQDMLGNLRSKCAALHSGLTPPLDAVKEETEEKSSAQVAIAEEDNLLAYESTFADSLMYGHDDQTLLLSPATAMKSVASALISPANEPLLAMEAPVNMTRYSRSADLSFDMIAPHPPPESAPPPVPPTSPTETPGSPSSPQSAGSPSLSSPRGILKRCKSVRFASVADHNPAGQDKQLVVAPVAQPPVRAPRHSTGSAGMRRPSPLRHTYAPRLNVKPPATTTSPSKAVPSKPVTQFLQAAGRQRPTTSIPSPMRASMPLPSTQPRSPPPSKDRRATATLPRSFRKTLPPPVSPNLNPTPKPSLRRVMSFKRLSHDAEKENSTKKTGPKLSRARFTLDENSLRKETKLFGESSGKASKMPTPLRSIFTRFKH